MTIAMFVSHGRSDRFAQLLAFACLCVALISPSSVHADEAAATIAIADLKRDTPVDFAKEIQPLLAKHCVACHNTATHEGGLNLESPASMLKGGESGPAVIARKSAESLVLLCAAARASR